ncbi:MAG TPA: hypothetical protein VFK86_05255 [Bauldia sp.]|nr:hypothetical protein [Bauldia sp.]
MQRLGLALAIGLAVQGFAAGPAGATAGMVCDGLDNADVFVEMNLPRSAGSPPNWVRVGAPGRSFSTLGIDEDATPLTIRQAFDDGRTFYIDLSDEGGLEAVIKIRLLMAQEGDELPVYIGFVQVVGLGIYPISCIEDE